MNYARGANYERKLIEFLNTLGFCAVRIAGSGRSVYPNPDVLASNGSCVVAFECKSTQGDKVYLKEGDIIQLREFCKAFNCNGLFALHLRSKGFLFKKVSDFVSPPFVLSEENCTRDLL